MTRKTALFLFLIVVSILPATVACGSATAMLPFGSDDETATDAAELVYPTATPEPTPAPVTEDAGGYARAFYRAWEAGDYLGMYSLLSPTSQALVDSGSFVQRYREAMETATVQSVSSRPLALLQEGSEAQYSAAVTWETAAVGPIMREHTMRLVHEGGRWGVQWDEGLILPELAGGNRLSMNHLQPSRGNILDREGAALAFQGNAFNLGIIPGQIKDEAGLLAVLSRVLGRSADSIKALYATALPDWYVPIGDISEQTLQENILDLEPYFGAGLTSPTPRPARLYVADGVAPHVIGYTGPIPAESVADYIAGGYQGDETVGLAGLELWGEEYLNGERGGILSVVAPNGQVLGVLQERASQVARNVYTSFDSRFQAAVEQALADAIATHPVAEKGAIVVMDVNTGAIRAIASYPDYDPSVFDALREDGALGAVLNDPNQPLLNRATQGAYPAGSTFKLVTFAAALNSGLYTADTRYSSTGSWSRLGEEYTKYDWLKGGHGTISLRQAIVVSCNSCFYDAGYNMDAVDNTLLPRTAREFGLGELTGIRGVAESAGLIPDPEWKLTTIGEGWATGDTVNMSIGQGYVQVTPLQMARIAAAIANGGTLYQPTLIDRIGEGAGAPEEKVPAVADGQLPLTPDQIATLQGALYDVANGGYGTATHRFQGLPVTVAGKTGTAEAPPGPPHAWFIGYAPAAPYTTPDGRTIDAPEIAVAVVLENTGEGSEAAAPLFRRIIELYYGIEPLAPFPW